MANPQKENGFTPIANEILEALIMAKLSGSQLKIVFTVIRFTYGFNRKAAELSVSFIAQATNIHKTQVKRELKTLIDQRVISVVKESTCNSTRALALNKDYHQWGELVYSQGANLLPGSKPTPREQASSHSGSQVAPTQGANLLPQPGSEFAPQERHIKDNLKYKVFQCWNGHKIIVHKNLSKKIEKALDKALRENTAEEIETAINRYSIMLKDDSCTWCTYVWGLDSFLLREKGYKHFLDDGEKWLSYQNQQAQGGKRKGPQVAASAVPLGTEVPPWTSEPM